MLTAKLLDALQKDRHTNSNTTQRTCYVVRWGGGSSSNDAGEDDDAMIHPLLRRAKQVCRTVDVTPVWLQTCASEQCCLDPSLLSRLFEPRPMRSFLLGGSSKKDATNKKKKKKTAAAVGQRAPPRISVTGFGGPQRAALRHTIEAMGATYDDSMRKSTTHLIVHVDDEDCSTSSKNQNPSAARQPAASGPKYEKAVQWKLHCVTLDWLYHVAEYGWNESKEDAAVLSEERFAVKASSSTDDEDDAGGKKQRRQKD